MLWITFNANVCAAKQWEAEQRGYALPLPPLKNSTKIWIILHCKLAVSFSTPILDIKQSPVPVLPRTSHLLLPSCLFNIHPKHEHPALMHLQSLAVGEQLRREKNYSPAPPDTAWGAPYALCSLEDETGIASQLFFPLLKASLHLKRGTTRPSAWCRALLFPFKTGWHRAWGICRAG